MIQVFFGADHHPASASGVMDGWGERRCRLKTPRLSEPSLSEVAAASHQNKKAKLNISFCWKLSTLHHIHEAQTVGQREHCLRKREREWKRWSAWATGEDGRWLSTAALKRQNVAHNSDRCSLITAACQHLQQRTVVVFEVDPGPVTFWQSQSFPEQNESSISTDLTSNHIHRCSNRTDLCLKIRDKWAAQQKSCSYSSRSLSSSSRDSRARGPVVFTLLSTGHF